MPDLGTYAVEVSLAYGVSIALLVGVVALSVVQARRIKRALDEAEARRKK
jgi:heme exporter protein D